MNGKSIKLSWVFLLSNILLLTVSLSLFALIYKKGAFKNTVADISMMIKTHINYMFHRPLCPDCNVILVSLDTLSANHMPCYGYSRNTSPALCKFGKDNIQFDNAYANSYYTLPSHISIFTGLYQNNHGVKHAHTDYLNLKIPFLPEIMQAGGYYTQMGMRTDDPHMPLDKVYNRGIDKIIDEDKNPSLWTNDLEIFKKKVKEGKKTFMFLHTYFVHSPYVLEGSKLFTKKSFADIPTHWTEYATCSKEFIQFAKKAIKQNLDDRLWFDKSDAYRKLYKDFTDATDESKVCRENDILLWDIRFNYYFNKKNINTPEEVEYIQDLYDQKIVEMDRELNALFKLLEQPEIKNNTIVIITADHGEEFMEHNEIQHMTLYDSNVRIPLFMHIPGIAQKKVGTLAQSVDIVPTLLDLVDIRGDFRFQGESLTGFLFGDKDNKIYAVAEREGNYTKTIRDSKYKVFLESTDKGLIPYELYDVQKDPGEKNNILYIYTDIAESMKKQLTKILDL